MFVLYCVGLWMHFLFGQACFVRMFEYGRTKTKRRNVNCDGILSIGGWEQLNNTSSWVLHKHTHSKAEIKTLRMMKESKNKYTKLRLVVFVLFMSLSYSSSTSHRHVKTHTGGSVHDENVIEFTFLTRFKARILQIRTTH